MRTFAKLLIALAFVAVILIAGGCLGVVINKIAYATMPDHPKQRAIFAVGLALMGGPVLAVIIPRLFSFLAKKVIRL